MLLMVLTSIVSPLTVSATGFWKGFDISVKDNKITGEPKGNGEGFTSLIDSLKNFIVGIAGVATVIAVGFFIFNFMKLGGSNSRTRSDAISGLIYSGIATAGLGSVTLIAAMFYGMIG